MTITNGTVTLPTGTATFGGDFINSGGSFTGADTTTLFNGTGAGQVVTFGGSDLATTTFDGVGGSWTITDTGATTTGSFTVSNGAVTLPPGVLAVANDFVIEDTISHNGGTIRLYDPSAGHATNPIR
ncbi:MAG: hypothetical protein R3B69_00400 [Candidatus Paceibacterota bacterium]